jgi:uncharacterized protein
VFIYYYWFNYNLRHIMASPKTVRVLSLDGGGSRGIVHPMFLKRFLEQWGVDQSKLYESFDVFTGSSIGGMVASALILGWTPVEIKTFFIEKAPWIFTIRTAADVLAGSINASTPSNRPDTVQKVIMLGTADPFYKSVDNASNYGDSRLRAEVDTVFGELKLNDLKANIIIPSFEQTTLTPVLFSNIDNPYLTYGGFSAKDVVLATSAAPIYFPSHPIQDGQYIDGGVFINDPVLYGKMLGKLIYPDAKRFCVLSIGAGLGETGFHVPSGQPGPTGGIPLLYSLINTAMVSGQEGANWLAQVEYEFANKNLSFYRFQMIIDHETYDTGLDNTDTEFYTYLEQAVNEQYDKDEYKIDQFISRLNDE